MVSGHACGRGRGRGCGGYVGHYQAGACIDGLNLQRQPASHFPSGALFLFFGFILRFRGFILFPHRIGVGSSTQPRHRVSSCASPIQNY